MTQHIEHKTCQKSCIFTFSTTSSFCFVSLKIYLFYVCFKIAHTELILPKTALQKRKKKRNPLNTPLFPQDLNAALITPHSWAWSCWKGRSCLRARVFVCVCARVYVRVMCMSSPAAWDELPAVSAATVFASSSSSPPCLCLSVQSGNVDHRGLSHRCRVSLHLQTATLGISSLTAVAYLLVIRL